MVPSLLRLPLNPFVSSEVETRQRSASRPSTSLGTNGGGVGL